MAQVESENSKNKHEPPDLEILCRKVVYQQGSFRRVVEYIAGHYPELGKLNGYKGGGYGWQEKETIREHDVIIPLKTLIVKDP